MVLFTQSLLHLFSGCAALPQQQNRFADFIKVGELRNQFLQAPMYFCNTIHQSFEKQ